jgi:hypothetical protein
MEVVIEQLREIQNRLFAIDSRLASLFEANSDSPELLEEAYNLIDQELLEVHKLENVILHRKIQLFGEASQKPIYFTTKTKIIKE